ncbi:MAG TPA: hypothetical protein VGD47_04795 [Steroidobacteraceae bacterium]
MSTRSMLGSFVVVLVCAASVGPTRGETPWTGVLTQQALASGHHSTLPPHLSRVLGLTAKAESIEVRQLVTRADQTVRTFNVSVAHHGDVVIFFVDERTQATVAYLLGPGGKLRKAVSYQPGGEPRELSASEAHAGLAGEIRYWSGLARESVPKPAH